MGCCGGGGVAGVGVGRGTWDVGEGDMKTGGHYRCRDTGGEGAVKAANVRIAPCSWGMSTRQRRGTVAARDTAQEQRSQSPVSWGQGRGCCGGGGVAGAGTGRGRGRFENG